MAQKNLACHASSAGQQAAVKNLDAVPGGLASPGAQAPSKIRKTRHEMSRKHETRCYLPLAVRTAMFQSDFLMGSYLFDWWETGLVYGIYASVIGLICYGISKQMVAGAAALHGAVWH